MNSKLILALILVTQFAYGADSRSLNTNASRQLNATGTLSNYAEKVTAITQTTNSKADSRSRAKGIVTRSEGSGAKGGGDIESCTHGLLTPFSSDMSALTDTKVFNDYNSIALQIFDFADEETLLQSILDYLDQSAPIDAMSVRLMLSQLRFFEIESINTLDTGAKIGWNEVLFFGCSREQVAVQDLNAHVVSLKRSIYEKLNPITKALLKIHEAFISLYSADNTDLKTLETVTREKVAKIFNAWDFNRSVLHNALKRLGRDPRDAVKILMPQVMSVVADETDLQHRDESQSQQERFEEEFMELIQSGFDPNGKFYCDLPPLEYLLGHRNGLKCDSDGSCTGTVTPASAVMALIDLGASLNDEDISGAKPIFWAVWHSHHFDPTNEWSVVQSMVEKGADINASWCRPGTPQGALALTPLDLAIQFKDKSLEKTIRRIGGKTAAELTQTCAAVPQLTEKLLRSAQCNRIPNGDIRYLSSIWAH